MKSAVGTAPELVVDTGTGRVVVLVVESEHTTVVELHGDIGGEAFEPLQDCVVAGIEDNEDVTVDLTDAAVIDCASLNVLVRAARLAGRRGHEVRLVGAPPTIRRILAAAGLDTELSLTEESGRPFQELSADQVDGANEGYAMPGRCDAPLTTV